MPLYSYSAFNEEGKLINNTLDADDIDKAKAIIQNNSMLLCKIEEKKSNTKRKKNLNTKQKSLFIRQLSTLLLAGFTLEKTLRSIQNNCQNQKLKDFITDINKKVLEGVPFSQALGSHNTFSNTFIATIKAGEASGHLAATLNRLADFSESQNEIKDGIKQALVYPIILFIIMFFMIGYLLTNVIPDVVDIFIKSNQELPKVTQYLLIISHLLRKFWWIIFIMIPTIIFVFKKMKKIERIRRSTSRFLLRVPAIGKFLKTQQITNYISTLSVLLNNGVRLPDALRISAETVENKAIKIVLSTAPDEVTSGKSLTQTFKKDKNIFPPMLLEFIASGEESASLPLMLKKADEIYQKEIQIKTKTIINLLSPLLILFMGGLIFFVVLGVLLPILDLNNAIN